MTASENSATNGFRHRPSPEGDRKKESKQAEAPQTCRKKISGENADWQERVVAGAIDALIVVAGAGLVIWLRRYDFNFFGHHYFSHYHMPGLYERRHPMLFTSLHLIGGIILWMLINFLPLKKRGQSIGKMIMGIRIITLDRYVPDMRQLLAQRYGMMFLLVCIPVLGWLLSIVDMSAFYWKNRRCGHDLLAGTRVVYC